MKLHTCADQQNCGKSYLAIEQSEQVYCPYCRELAERESNHL